LKTLGATVGGNDTEGAAVVVGACVGGNNVGKAVGPNDGDAVGENVGFAVGFLLLVVGVDDGCVDGCTVGCPVGLPHRGKTFIQAFLHCVGKVLINAAAPVNPGFVTELNVKDDWAFDMIVKDPVEGAGP